VLWLTIGFTRTTTGVRINLRLLSLSIRFMRIQLLHNICRRSNSSLWCLLVRTAQWASAEVCQAWEVHQWVVQVEWVFQEDQEASDNFARLKRRNIIYTEDSWRVFGQ
jgi:hypothetical protein